jgi:Nucleotidyl transferase AbiEii toxin, Type IV TA system
MTVPSLPDKVLAIHDRLAAAKLAHAFGGALALAYYAEPRATIDIDVNVFVEPGRHAEVQAELAELGIGNDVAPEVVERDGQCRIWWGSTPVDLFYAYHDLHAAMRKAVRKVPFASATIPVLAPEHLIACKAVFNRPRDWLDVEQMLVGAPDVDRDEVADWLEEIVGGDDPRAQRFATLSRELAT